MFNLVSEDALELIKGGDWLAKFVLEQLSQSEVCKMPHKRAIQLTQIACQFLQATYDEKDEPLVSVMVETADLLTNFSRPGGDA